MAIEKCEQVDLEFEIEYDDLCEKNLEAIRVCLGRETMDDFEGITLDVRALVNRGHRGTREDPPEDPSVESLKLHWQDDDKKNRVFPSRFLTASANERLDEAILTEWGEGAWVPERRAFA